MYEIPRITTGLKDHFSERIGRVFGMVHAFLKRNKIETAIEIIVAELMNTSETEEDDFPEDGAEIIHESLGLNMGEKRESLMNGINR
ncbi:MAG: hypothetical protein OXE77_10305 [Flavobacteriaceae bacterium]|nr:hypothetical protein [Flavobacteriaceae bacterium]MCY4266423.1 hypothetical protein [Flavobacteriaceae bacterium]